MIPSKNFTSVCRLHKGINCKRNTLQKSRAFKRQQEVLMFSAHNSLALMTDDDLNQISGRLVEMFVSVPGVG